MFLKRIPFLLLIVGLTCSCVKETSRPNPVTIAANVTNASTFNGADGSINISISGGESPFHFFWSTGDTSEDLTGVYAGTYTLKLIYSKGGEALTSKDFSVSQPDPTPLSLTFQTTDVSTYGNDQGKIKLSVTGGTPPYSYRWSSGDTISSLTKLFAGTYEVTVKDHSYPFQIVTSGSVTIDQPVFLCGRDSIRDIDGFIYPTVKLGTQCWTSANLRTIHAKILDDSVVTIEGRFCNLDYCDGPQGAHYNWDAMMNRMAAAPEDALTAEVQGICPVGWHIPTKGEVDILDSWLKINGNGGSGILPAPKVRNQNSSSGLNALLIGNFGYDVYLPAAEASFWTSTEYKADLTQGRILYITQDLPLFNKGPRPKVYGLSVRCAKNAE